MEKVFYLYPYWGSEHLKLDDWLNTFNSQGFDGIEMNIPDNPHFESQWHKQLDKLRNSQPNVLFVAQQVPTTKMESVEEHIFNVMKRLHELVPFEPTFINSHTGKDYYSFDDNCKMIEAVENFSNIYQIPVYHEIHRGRFSFHAASTLPYLIKFPCLKLVGDLSHWCVVSESMLDGQQHIINQVIPFIYHIHARVGFEQSPQVSNPFAPEWESRLEIFTKWWQQIIDYHRVISITPEFGPYPYMPQSPIDRQPMANQNELNLQMKAYLQNHLTLKKCESHI